jgi:hypothetical protein
VVVDLGIPGLSAQKLMAVWRNNPRLDKLAILVVTDIQPTRRLENDVGLLDVDAVVLRDQLNQRLVPTLQRLLCTSGFHYRASAVPELAEPSRLRSGERG